MQAIPRLNGKKTVPDEQLTSNRLRLLSMTPFAHDPVEPMGVQE